MNVVVDRFGRLVLPKAVRNHFGLTAGSELDLEEVAGTIVLRLIDERPPLEINNGVLVFTGKTVGNIDAVLSDVRNDRLHHLGAF